MTTTHGVTRRGLGATLLGGATAALALPAVRRASAAAAGGELRIFTWEGYADKPWVAAFEKRTGATARVTYTGSVDEMFAKMQGSDGADFDVLAFDTGSFKRYIEQGLIQPLDMAKLPDAKNLQPAFRDHPAVTVGGKTYGIPFAWGSLPLVYDKAQFPNGAPDSWAAMWDPANAQQMIALDDANNSIVNCAILLGYKDPFNLSDEQFQAIKAKLIEQKKLLSTYYAGFEDGVKIFADNGTKLMFSMGEPQVGMLQKRGVDAALTIPKEGAIGWLDCWNVSKGCKALDLAHAWIDTMLDPQVGAYISKTYNYGNTTDAAANEAAGMVYADRLVFLEAPEDFQKRTTIWNEVKAAPV
jgi:putative spermidine/putrescine transport system substrate-binding protein/spermidine/putrescine transport system substrate-binding protein